jgi:hypothetical protein
MGYIAEGATRATIDKGVYRNVPEANAQIDEASDMFITPAPPAPNLSANYSLE